jgi:hypothetical protein
VVNSPPSGECEKKSKSLICLRVLTYTPSTPNAQTFAIRRANQAASSTFSTQLTEVA